MMEMSQMKRLLVAAAVLLLAMSFPMSLEARHGVKRYLTKESAVDMKNMNHIFLGWVDMNPDEWAFHGYSTKTEWTDVIGSLNAEFLRSLQVTYLPGRTITGAKDKGDENAVGNDLYIKFSDVRVDYDNYHLILAIHFIDPKTNQEIASIPVRPYYGNDWGLRNYLKAALDEVGTKLEVEVTGELQGRKKK
jgi:hypothetical protein